MKKILLVLLPVILAGLFSFTCNGQIISTIAGDTGTVYNGDGIPATAAHLSSPFAITSDHSGNIYIGDMGHARIRRINTAGIITTVVGTGVAGYSGNGGPATAAEILTPIGMVTDKVGNLYFADNRNHCVRKVDTNGIITLFAGFDTGVVSMRPLGDGGPATAAMLNYPLFLAADDSDNIYISDGFNDSGRIRKVDNAGIITTFAGGGHPSSGSGDGGPATNSKLNNPSGIAFDKTGSILVVTNDWIRKIDPAGMISTIPLSGSVPSAFMEQIAIGKDGRIYLSSEMDYHIWEVTTSGTVITVAGNAHSGFSGDGGYAYNASIGLQGCMTVDHSGNLLFCDYGNDRVRMIRYAVLVNPAEQPEAGINIYPNPATHAFTINIASPNQDEAKVTIVNLSGAKVNGFSTMCNNPSQITLDIPPGVYFVAASTAAGKWIKQLVIE